MMIINKINRQALCIMAAASFFITACKKDPVIVPQQQGTTKKIRRVAVDEGNFSAFTYNANGSLHKMTQASTTGGVPNTTEIIYTYNDLGKVTVVSIAGIVNYKYVYTNNRVTKAEFYSNNFLGAYDLFTYTGERITTIEKFFRAANGSFELDSKSDCSYYDNGNIREIKAYIVNAAGQFVISSTTQYLQYDNKKSPFKDFGEANLGIFFDFLAENNITRLNYLDANGSVISDKEIAYTYSADGYPLVSATKSTQNGIVTNSTSTFTYE